MYGKNENSENSKYSNKSLDEEVCGRCQILRELQKSYNSRELRLEGAAKGAASGCAAAGSCVFEKEL